jgi:serine/threonine protein kinase
MESPNVARNLEIVLVHELSSGTFARLYLAEARAPGGIERIVAVKILREQWSESAEILNRTRDEARLLARLRHKNILRVEDLAEIDGQLAIIMEFVDGLDLKQLVDGLTKERLRLPARAVLDICAATASALDAAHNRVPYGHEQPLHVVHRDIKPSNVMVSVEGEVKVLDFGTARSTQQRSAQTGALRFGSLKYMSPERREGDRGEIASDVYALGLTMLELLRGAWLPLLPLDVAEHDEALATHITRLSDLGMPNAQWDQALRSAILRMVAGEADHRPPIAEVQKLLRAFADQASGPTLETFAQEHVSRLTRSLHGNSAGGSLSGTRFVVNVLPETLAKAESKPVRPGAARPPRPPAVSEEDRPTSAATSLEMSAPEDWGDEATVQRANPAVPDLQPATPVAAEEVPSPQVVPAASNTLIWVGVAAFALFVAGVVGVSGVVAWLYVTRTLPTPDAVPRQAAVAAVAGAPVQVEAAGAAVQWIRMQNAAGERIAEGKATLTGSVLPGVYALSVKLVGKPVLQGQIEVPGGGVSLQCALEKDGSLSCSGMSAPVLLRR